MANAAGKLVDKKLVDSMVDEIIAQMKQEQKGGKYVQVSLPQADIANLRKQLEVLQKTLKGDEIEIAHQFSDKLEDMHHDFESRIDAVEAGMKELKNYVNAKTAESGSQAAEAVEAKLDRLSKQVQEIRDEVEGLAEDVDAVRSPQPKKEDGK